MSTRPADLRRPSGGNALTKKYGPLPGWAWALVAGVGVYVVVRYIKGKKAATTSTTTAAGASTTPVAVGGPTPYAATTGGGGSGGGGSSGSSGGTSAGSAPTTLTQTLGLTPKNPTQTGTGGAPVITIGGKKYRVLGQLGSGATPLSSLQYAVYGGAPVYFGNENTIKQGPTNEKTGMFAYVPTTYSNLVYKATPPAAPAKTVSANQAKAVASGGK